MIVVDWINEAGPAPLGAEVGVKSGRTTLKLLEGCPGLTLFCVDPWADQPGGQQWGQTAHDRHFSTFLEHTAKHAARRVIVGMPSAGAAKTILRASLDFVFLDACHTPEAVLADIEAWAACVRRGGWVGGRHYPARVRGRMRGLAAVGQGVDRYGAPVEVVGNTWRVRVTNPLISR